MSHIWMSHVTHLNESCRTYEWVMSQRTHMQAWACCWIVLNESCHIYEWVMSQRPRMQAWACCWIVSNESPLPYATVMAHLWMSHATYMTAPLSYTWVVMSQVSRSHVKRMNESRHTGDTAANAGMGVLLDSFEVTSELPVIVKTISARFYTHKWVPSRLETSHVKYTYEWVIRMSHTNESCYIHLLKPQVSCLSLRRRLLPGAQHKNESCHTYN